MKGERGSGYIRKKNTTANVIFASLYDLPQELSRSRPARRWEREKPDTSPLHCNHKHAHSLYTQTQENVLWCRKGMKYSL